MEIKCAFSDAIRSSVHRRVDASETPNTRLKKLRVSVRYGTFANESDDSSVLQCYAQVVLFFR
jgi:hypothetical protein